MGIHLQGARDLYSSLVRELHRDIDVNCRAYKGQVVIESSCSAVRVLSGKALRDSFHLGSTLVNDFGRPFENGFNNYSGLSGYASAGRFLIYARGEFEGAPSAVGYSIYTCPNTLEH